MNDAGLTLLVVTHNPDVGRRADRVLQMFDGRIVSRVAGSELPRTLGFAATAPAKGAEAEA